MRERQEPHSRIKIKEVENLTDFRINAGQISTETSNDYGTVYRVSENQQETIILSGATLRIALGDEASRRALLSQLNNNPHDKNTSSNR